MLFLRKWQQWWRLAHPGSALGLCHFCIQGLSLSLLTAAPNTAHIAIWKKWSKKAHTTWVMGNTGAMEVDLSLSCLRCRPVCELLTSEIWASDHPPVSPSSPPTSQGGLSPSIGPQDCGLSCSPSKVGVCQCNVLFPLSPLSGAQILTWSLFFPSYLIMCVSFL